MKRLKKRSVDVGSVVVGPMFFLAGIEGGKVVSSVLTSSLSRCDAFRRMCEGIDVEEYVFTGKGCGVWMTRK